MQRRLLTVLPALAAAFVVAVLFGPGRARPLEFARVRAAAGADGAVRSLRVETLRRDGAREQASPIASMRVFVERDGARREVHSGPTDEAGIVEVRVDPPARSGDRLVLEGPNGELGARVLQVPEHERLAVVEQLGAIAGKSEGSLPVRVDVVRGTMVSSFDEEVRIACADAPGGTLELDAESAEPTSQRLTLDARGEVRAKLRALGPTLALEARVRAGDRTGRFVATVPSKLGAVWLDPSSNPGRLVVVSPSPRDRVFASFYAAEGRVGGASAPLSASPDGFHRAEIEAPTALVGVRLSSDASELGQSTVAWPAPGREGLVTAPRLVSVVDGAVAAELREKRRLVRVRVVVGLVLAFVGALEIGLFVRAARRERRLLDERLASIDPALRTIDHLEQSSLGGLFGFAVLVAVAFAAIAATALYPR
jgi:hypothetical protein